MTASAWEVKGRVAHVKVVAALGAFDESSAGYRNTEEEKPDQEYSPSRLVRLRQLQRCQRCRQVYDDQTPEIPALSSNCAEPRSEP